MADWDLPDEDELYLDILDELRARDVDAGTLFLNAPTNPVTGMIRYVRATNKFQEYDGATWVDLLLSLAGGGTAAATAAGARTSLGLGTIAVQNANGVAITGGTIAGLGSLGVSGATTVGGDATLSGLLKTGSTPITLTDAAGKIVALDSTRFASLSGANLTALNASNLASGTLPDARFPATLPALNGSLLTALNASALASGTVPAARLGSGSGGATKFLREDNTWQTLSLAMQVGKFSGTWIGSGGAQDFTISPSLTDYTKAAVVYFGGATGAVTTFNPKVTLTSNSNARVDFGAQTSNIDFIAYVMQGS